MREAFNTLGEIEERLAHTHHHDVELAVCGRQAVARGDKENLTDNLARGQVAFDAHLRGEAELAIDRAPYLGGNADRIATVLGHEYGLNGASVFQLKQVPARTVGGVKPRFGFRQSDGEPLGQRLSQRRGQSGNFVEIFDLLLVQGLIDLTAAKSRLPRS